MMAFEYLKMSNIGTDGTERCLAYENFALDNRGIWYGKGYLLVNNHKTSKYEIYYCNEDNSVFKLVGKGKEETLTLAEFKKWLQEHNVSDGYMEFLRNNKWYCEKYPTASGVEYIQGGGNE